MSDSLPTGFSIVLCTYNGAARLQPTLQHLAALELPGGLAAELVVVNNASTDDTEAMVTGEWQKLGAPYALRIIQEPRAGKGYAVETGYDAARYSYIVTVDDDNWLDREYLRRALELFQAHGDVGILQGFSTGVFEQEPPQWIHKDNLEHFFVIGAPAPAPGYYADNAFGAWGAGMVLKKRDWDALRTLGFSFLTSKLPGKAAGEDHELAIALLLMGRRIYYSDRLRFRHYMPAERVNWDKLKQNFDTFGYVSRYNFLYALVIHAYRQGYQLNPALAKKKFRRYFFRAVKRYTLKQQVAYWLVPKQEYYQLRLLQYYAQYKWFNRLLAHTPQDIEFLQKWMVPLLREEKSGFTMNELYYL